MSSSVFFKFKSQKEPSRITFDGTGISVFELKRQIIQINKLGDGSDFDLAIYNQDTNEEYDDDTTIIPRSTSVTARRLPPIKPGKGTARRYVDGKMPTNALPNAGRREKNFGPSSQAPKKVEDSSSGGQGGSALPEGLSEEDRIAAMFEVQSEQWNKTQEQLATATPVYRGNRNFQKNAAPAPSHPPPAGYVCYRCGEKGHWIQQCPTNADPNFDGRPRVKRTTGIPRSFLKTVEKPVVPTNDEQASGQSNPTSIMVNAEGEYVVALPDQTSWDAYQKKAGTTKSDAPKGSKELQDRGIECSLCHKLMKDAVKTPCCGKVYCEECIQNALLESDLVCPGCEAKETLLDHLVPDTETREKVATYLKENETGSSSAVRPSNTAPLTAAQETKKYVSPPATNAASPAAIAKSPPLAASTICTTPVPSSSAVSKKRPAEAEIRPEVPRGPAAMRNQMTQQQQFNNMPFVPMPQQQPFYTQFQPQQQFGNGFAGYGNMGMSGMSGFYNQNAYGYGGGMNGGFQQQQQGYGFGGYPMQQQQPFMNQGAYGVGMMDQHQKTVFSEPFPSEEDSPYMRKPVNPHRHARPKRIRPSDFKAVGGEMM